MKKLCLVSTTIILLVVQQIILGCKEEQKPSQLELQTTVLNVGAEGGHYTIHYEIINPHNDAAVTVDYSGDWIVDFITDEPGVISFDVLANETQEERSTDINLKYPGITTVVSFTVVQEADVVPPFTINVNEITEISVNIDIIPEDKEMTYINFTTPVEYAPDDDNALYAEDMAYFQSISEVNQVPLEEVIASYAGNGELIDQYLSGLIPGTDYVTYAYGIDLSTNERTTDIARAYYATKDVERIDVDFDFDCNVNGGYVNLSITPENYDGYYAFEVYSGVTDEMDIDELCEQNWVGNVAFFLSVGYSYEDILNELCQKGPLSISLSLSADTRYVVVAHAVNEQALKCSGTSYQFFNTESIAPSDNVIGIEISNIKARTADVRVTTTNLDPYVIFISQSEILDEYTSDEDIINYFVQNSNPNLNSGGFTETMTNLVPDTEYSFCAFGYNAGTVTTELFRADCKTQESEQSDVGIELLYDKYYDAQEVAELDPSYSDVPEGFAIVPVEAVVDQNAVACYYDMFAVSYYESLHLTEDQLVSELVEAGQKPSEFIFRTLYDMPMLLLGVAMDADGNFGPVWNSEEFTLSRDGVSDPHEFVESQNNGIVQEQDSYGYSRISSVDNSSKTMSNSNETTICREKIRRIIFPLNSAEDENMTSRLNISKQQCNK